MVYFIEILRGKSKHVNFNVKSNFFLWQSKKKSPVRVIAIFSNSIKFFRINPVFGQKIFGKSFNHTSTSIKRSQLLFRPEFLKDSDAIYKILKGEIEVHQIPRRCRWLYFYFFLSNKISPEKSKCSKENVVCNQTDSI